MAIDTRKLEAELLRIFRGHGILTSNYDGVEYVGIASSYIEEGIGPRVPTIPKSTTVSLAVLAQEIAEVL